MSSALSNYDNSSTLLDNKVYILNTILCSSTFLFFANSLQHFVKIPTSNLRRSQLLTIFFQCLLYSNKSNNFSMSVITSLLSRCTHEEHADKGVNSNNSL